MIRSSVISRARSQINIGTQYELGHGGNRPNEKFAHDDNGCCDCSGFIAWCLGVNRHTDNPWYVQINHGWLETTAIVRDVASPFGIFRGLNDVELPEPGDVFVFGDGGGHQGHVGLISKVSKTGDVLKVVHCSMGNQKLYKDAVQETGPRVFVEHGAIVARCALVTEDPVA